MARVHLAVMCVCSVLLSVPGIALADQDAELDRLKGIWATDKIKPDGNPFPPLVIQGIHSQDGNTVIMRGNFGPPAKIVVTLSGDRIGEIRFKNKLEKWVVLNSIETDSLGGVIKAQKDVPIVFTRLGTAAEAKMQPPFQDTKKIDALVGDLEAQKREQAQLLDELRKERERMTSLVMARQQLGQSGKAPPKSDALNQFKDLNFGNYHALVIGNNDYKFIPKLQTAVNDAQAISDLLHREYGFTVKLLIDAKREDILDAFDQYRETLTANDNLLIYYAGHGWLDKSAEEGYWLPVDAKSDRRSRWLSNSSISSTMKALNAKHVMVVADSCYSGTLARGLNIKEMTPDYIRRMIKKRARLALTSGGLEPVADDGGSGHSPFANAFLSVLGENTSVIDGTQLFSAMRRPVVLNAEQTPEYSDVRKAGHEGGDFLFVRR